MMDIRELNNISYELRKIIVNVSFKTGAHHIGSAFSCIDILTALYFYIMSLDDEDHEMPVRDWFMLSKGHAALAHYATLALRGYFKVENLFDEFLVDGGLLGGHPDRHSVPGVEMSSGSLGHGLSIGAGVALAAKIDKSAKRTFILLGDGECNEGMIWEAALFASHRKLDNLVAIVDYNRLQGFGTTDKVLSLDPLKLKFQSFGWSVKVINGNNMAEIVESMKKLPFEVGKPNVLIANTIKGKGSTVLENKLESHYLVLDSALRDKIINDLHSAGHTS
jgi:transketolase